MSSQRDWIRQRLPADASFSKNGLTQTVDEAITSALADNTSGTDDANKRNALADLLDILAADINFEEERLGDWSGKGQLLSERADALREEASSDTTSPGSFSFVPATFRNAAPSDEYSS